MSWKQCPTCGHLHMPRGQERCKEACCKVELQPVAVTKCGECFGEGTYRDQIDEERPWKEVPCATCRGRGVVPTK